MSSEPAGTYEVQVNWPGGEFAVATDDDTTIIGPERSTDDAIRWLEIHVNADGVVIHEITARSSDRGRVGVDCQFAWVWTDEARQAVLDRMEGVSDG